VKVRDVELLELLRDQPQLLAVADAVAETQPRQAPRGRRVRRSLIAVPALVAVSVGALLLLPQGKHGVVDRALAAIGDAPVMHIVADVPSGVVDVNLQTGARTESNFRVELWADQKADRFHFVMRYRGQPYFDVLWPDDAKNGTTVDGSIDPAFTALWTGYRNALAKGDAQRVDEGTEYGHHVYWLRFGSAGKEKPASEVAVDATTFKPVVFRAYDASSGKPVDEHILTAETTAFNAADFTRQGPDPLDGVGSVSSGGSQPMGDGTTSTDVPPGWLTAGPQADGQPLAAVIPQSITSADKQTTNGYQLVYGRLEDGGFPDPDATTIDEMATTDDPSMFPDIPPGTVEIETGQASSSSSSGGNKSHPIWTGNLIKNGRYITITSQHGEQAVIEIAKALHTAN